MTYGQFTGYEPHPDIPGAYNFQTTGGSPYTFAGPEADQLKARLDAANQATTVADNSGGAPGFADPNIQANAILADAQAKGAPGPLKLPVGGGEAPASIAALPPDQAAEVASGGMHPVVSNGVNTGLISGPGGVYDRTPGTAGISQAKRQKTATQGTATPTSESKSVSGGFEQSKEYQQDMAKSYQDEQKAIEEKRNADITAQEQGRAIAGQQFEQQTGQMQQQQALVQQVQAHVDQAQATRDQALQDYSSAKVDPNRIFHGTGGAFKGIAAALAAGAGAYGAAMNHTQNFAQQAIDSAINRDVAAQEADLRTKKDTSDTALGDLVRRGMSLDQAKNTLTTIQRGWAAQQLQLSQGASGTDQINANSDKMQADLQQKMAQDNEAYRQKSLGQAQQTVQSQILYPVAAAAGGMRRLSGTQGLAVAGQVAENTGKQVSNVKTEAEAGKTEAETAKLRGASAKPNAGEVDVKAGLHELNQFDQAFKAAGDPHIFVEHGPLATKTSEELSSKADILAPSLTMALTGQKRPNPTLQLKITETLKRGGPKARALLDEARSHLQSRLEQEQSKGPGGGGLQQALGDAMAEEQAGTGEQ